LGAQDVRNCEVRDAVVARPAAQPPSSVRD
jgi:hypothetical protein